ncbi:MAG: hemerythrin domain-containing protein [Byssovorax sp.]
MKILDDLVDEHRLIERVIGALFTFAEARAAGGEDRGDGAAFLRFFRAYAGHHHHAREEAVLFPALIEQTFAPVDRGPVAVLTEDHRVIAGLLDRLEPLLLAREASAEMPACARRYGEALLHHIDAENHVLFPEAERRFLRAGVGELASPPPEGEAEAARAAGEALALRHPPADLGDVLRGESCTACPAFGDRCEGIERAWSSEDEWDDMLDRVG